MAARPRGGDWLEDEAVHWRLEGVDTVLSLLERQEEREIGLEEERQHISSHGMVFLSLPIPDRGTPSRSAELEKILASVDRSLNAGKSVVVHCRQGVGRTSVIAACLLIQNGVEAEGALRILEAARGIALPETKQQRLWIDQFAGTVAVVRRRNHHPSKLSILIMPSVRQNYPSSKR